MAKGAAPSSDQLLELLKRAAEELKHAQEEARTAVIALQKEQAAHQKTEAELEAVQKQLKGASSQQSTDEGLLKDQIDAERENAKALDARVKELEALMQRAATAHEARVKELEVGLEGSIAEREALRAKVAEADTAISISQQQEEAKRAAQERTHEEALSVLGQEHANALQTAELESQRALEAAAAERVELETGQRSMLDDAAGRLVEMEQQLTQERDKHQLMAQKLLETRSRVRELEASLAQEQERVKGLETAATQMAEVNQRALREADQAHAAASANLQEAYGQTRAELQKTTDAWQQVERQYEALHREMLLTLEQRDDARRQLDNERTERERLSRAQQGHR